MSGKYAFAKNLKEVRFLFCQTGEHSAATRYGHFTIENGAREPLPMPPHACPGRLIAVQRGEDAPKSKA